MLLLETYKQRLNPKNQISNLASISQSILYQLIHIPVMAYLKLILVESHRAKLHICSHCLERRTGRILSGFFWHTEKERKIVISTWQKIPLIAFLYTHLLAPT